jgi:hypothetical protein
MRVRNHSVPPPANLVSERAEPGDPAATDWAFNDHAAGRALCIRDRPRLLDDEGDLVQGMPASRKALTDSTLTTPPGAYSVRSEEAEQAKREAPLMPAGGNLCQLWRPRYDP